MVDEIVLISSPRSGTNYLCDTMANFQGVVNFLELFSPEGVFGLQWHPDVVRKLSQISNVDFSEQNSPDLIKYVSQNRIKFLKDLREAVKESHKSGFIYKIFPNQVGNMDINEIVHSGDRVFLFLSRSRLDTFISFKKAQQTGKWVNSNSKDMQIEVEFDEFMNWAKSLDLWYAEMEKKVKSAGRRYCFLSYETDINIRRETMIEKVYISLRSLGVFPIYPTNIKPPTFQKQDSGNSPFDKISSGMALKQRLIDERLLVRYALRTFFTPRPTD